MTSPDDPLQSPAPSAPSVVFYWRPGCGFCSRLREQLRGAGVTLDERNIWDDREAAAFVRSVARGNETVPTVVVGGTALVNPPARTVLGHLGHDVGADDRTWRRQLRRR